MYVVVVPAQYVADEERGFVSAGDACTTIAVPAAPAA
jgi:hypothetical protein